jgi:hypothetical protein
MHEFSIINGLLWAGILLPVGSGLVCLLYMLSKFWLEELDLGSDGLLKVARIICAISLLCFVAGTFKACGSIDWSTPCCKKNQSDSGE